MDKKEKIGHFKIGAFQKLLQSKINICRVAHDVPLTWHGKSQGSMSALYTSCLEIDPHRGSFFCGEFSPLIQEEQ